jgi:hypothetical protein
MQIPNNLKDAIQNDNLVIFAGSGLSKQFNLPDWKKLVEEVIVDLGEDNDYFDYLPLLKKNKLSPIEVLEKLKPEHGQIRKYIKENFYLTKGNFESHKKILKLSSQIITTNYDNGFEMAADNKIIPSTYTSNFNISEVNKSSDEYILKLHGSVHEVDNCILFKDDYEKLYANDSSIIEKLKSIFIGKTILFIGFSFNDLEINLIFEKLNLLFSNYNKHYVVSTSSSDFSSIPFLNSIQIQDYTQIDNFIDSCLVHKPLAKQGQVAKSTDKTQTILKKIVILCPNPVDLDFGSDLINVRAQFENLDATIYHGTLNFTTLNSIDDYDLLIVITKLFKSMLYIESETIKSDLVTPKDISDAIPNESIPIVYITDKQIDVQHRTNGIFVSSFKNSIISKLIFKAIRNDNLEFQESEICFHGKKWLPQPILKGSASVCSLYNITFKNLNIDRKSLNIVVGRLEEQISITSRLLTIVKTNKFLNIKASGGLGKTTLIRKVACELFIRGHFKDGVNFKSCENIKTYEDFEETLIQGFNLLNIIKFKDYLIEHYSNHKKQLLIILDNFESVVNNLSDHEFSKAVELLKFCTNYANIALTSRDAVNSASDFEDLYSLTPLTTDDAFKLFIKYYGDVRDDEIKVLRSEILEEILNNNPLAIKLVTSSRTRFSLIVELKEQLINNFFESTNEDYSLAFRDNADLNIERTKSLFQSINYSYITLTQREKLAFELLSLFPDGISLSNFKKCFEKTNSSNNVGDNDLRVLRDKSLVEDDSGTLKLQPIIRRFADVRFSKRGIELKRKYYTDAYQFNDFILEVITLVKDKKSLSEAYKFYNSVRNNLYKVLTYIEDINLIKNNLPDKLQLLDYVKTIDSFIINEKQIKEFVGRLVEIMPYFNDVEGAEDFLNVIKYRSNYFHREFDKSYKEMCKILPIVNIENREFSNETRIETIYLNVVSNIHSMEGFTLQHIKCKVKNESYTSYINDAFFYLGIYSSTNSKEIDFYMFEEQLAKKALSESDLENYITSLYQDEHLEIMQSTYTLSKSKKLPLARIKKLVITNPYTNGIKDLMIAFNTTTDVDKITHFEKALVNLKHIKYYYLEGLFYYTKFLYETGKNYREKLVVGTEMCNKFHYRYLSFMFENLDKKNDTQYKFEYNDYPIEDLSSYIREYNNYWTKKFKNPRYHQ